MTTHYNTIMQKIQYVFRYLKCSEVAFAVHECTAFVIIPPLVSGRCSVFGIFRVRHPQIATLLPVELQILPEIYLFGKRKDDLR